MRTWFRAPFRPSADNFWLFFGGIWLLVGFPFLCIGLGVAGSTYLRHQRLDEAGRATEGIVLTKSYSDDGDSSARHSVGYRFTAPGGRVLRGTADVDGATWDRLAERGPVRVTYLPSDPATHRIDGETRDWLLGGIFAVVGGIFTILGGFVFVRGLQVLRRVERLERGGREAEAEVLEVAPGSISVNDVPQYVIRYRYVDHRGKTHAGRSAPMPPEEAEAWQAGDRGTVRYDADRPGASVWVGR